MTFGLFLYGLQKYNYAILLGLFLLIVGFSYIAVRVYGKKNPLNKDHAIKIYFRVILAFYFFFLFSLTFNINRETAEIAFDRDTLLTRLYKDSNLVPFRTIRSICQNDFLSSFAIINIVGNIGALMPLGVLLPLVFPKARKLLPFILMVTGVVLFIEIVQLIFGVGKLDIDDLILNVAGAVIAFGLFRIITKLRQER